MVRMDVALGCKNTVKALPIPTTKLMRCAVHGPCSFRGGSLCLLLNVDTSHMPIHTEHADQKGGKTPAKAD